MRGGVFADDEVASPVAVVVAHGDHVASAAGALLGVDVGQVRVPGDLDVTAEERVQLILVGGEQDSVDGRAAGSEPRGKGLPDPSDAGW